jgi:flagellar biosynthetic protein FliP
MQTTNSPATNRPVTNRAVAAPQPPAAAPAAEQPRRRAVLNFARHYAEMVAAMFLGMLVLGFALAAPLELAGVDVAAWDADAPALALLFMSFTMTVPMVAWMRYRGHGWRPCSEMSAAMFVPTFAAIGLLWGAVATDYGTLMAIQHSVMFPAMLLVMLLRPHEYTGH